MFRRASWQRARRMRRPLPPAWQEVLERRLSIYRRLPRAEQQALAGLTQVLMGEVGFEAGIGLDRVDMPMRLMIAGQIALGLLHRPLADLPRLRTIIVYPGAYRARGRRQTPEGVIVAVDEERQGEAWEHGVIVLSWDDVAYDAEHIDDGLNVVLHEVAHVLDAETGEMDGVPLLPSAEMARRWRRAVEDAHVNLERRIRLGRDSVLDAYALEDRGELFAVASEAFFEAPHQLQREVPGLWSVLREFYGVDPSAWMDVPRPVG